MNSVVKNIQTRCFEFATPKVNSTFGKVKVLVATHEQIANGMKFTRESMEKAMNSLNYIPIIGQYSNEKDDYTDHGQTMKISNDGIEFEKNTKPIGVVIKDSGKFEMIKAKNGEMVEYVTCEGYIWLQECPEAETIFKGDDNAQSMEINLASYTSNEDWTYQVDEYEYTALCVLASDGTVKPAFHEAKVLTNFDSNEFKAKYSEMMTALDKYLKFQEEGGDVVEEDKVLDTETIETQENVDNTEQNQEVQDENKDNEFQEENVDATKETDNDVNYKDLYEQEKIKTETMQGEIITLQNKVEEFTKQQERNDKFSMINAYKGKIDDSVFSEFKEKVDTFSKERLEKELLSQYVKSLENKVEFTQDQPTSIPAVDTFSEVANEDLPESVRLIKKYSKKN